MSKSPSPKELPRQVSNPQPLPNAAEAREKMNQMWKNANGSAKSGYKQAISLLEEFFDGKYLPSAGAYRKLVRTQVQPDKFAKIVKEAYQLLEIAKQKSEEEEENKEQTALSVLDSIASANQKLSETIQQITSQNQTALPSCPQNSDQSSSFLMGSDESEAGLDISAKRVAAALFVGVIFMFIIFAAVGTSLAMMKDVKDENNKVVGKEFDVVKLILMIIAFLLGCGMGFWISGLSGSIDMMSED